MKKFLLMTAVIAVAVFSSCTKQDDTTPSNDKTILFSVGVAEIRTRSIEGSAEGLNPADVLAAINDLTIELVSATGTVLQTKSILDTDLAAIKAGQNIYIKNVDTRVETVRASMNLIADATSVNNIQKNAQGSILKSLEYVGQGSVDKNIPELNTDGNVVWSVEVKVKPAITRFETKGLPTDIAFDPATTPAGLTDGTRAAFKALTTWFSDEEMNSAEAAAAAAWKAVNGNPVGPIEYQYSLSYTAKYDAIKSINGIYFNNFIIEKGSKNLILHANNAAGDWDQIASFNYSVNGLCSHMWDNVNGTVAANQIVAYNLFPQSVPDGSALSDIKNGMPHLVIKLILEKGGVEIPRWITIRAFSTGGTTINKFEAGKAYRMAFSDIKLNPYTARMIVKAVADGKTGPEIPEDKEDEKTDPNPEPKGTDLKVKLEILNWDMVDMTPEW